MSTTAESPRPRVALLLDRDGTINVNHGYVYEPERTEWVPGIFELCTAARSRGMLLVVITNQAGIARGLYSEAQFQDYSLWMHAEFARRGVPLAATYHCPHHPDYPTVGRVDGCDCRKPKPGMILSAAKDLGLELDKCVMVGDAASDMQAAASAGVGRAFILCAEQLSDGLPGYAEPVASLFDVALKMDWLNAPKADPA